jgi:DNA-directed RNA polymerase specialized sigma24 family protein
MDEAVDAKGLSPQELALGVLSTIRRLFVRLPGLEAPRPAQRRFSAQSADAFEEETAWCVVEPGYLLEWEPDDPCNFWLSPHEAELPEVCGQQVSLSVHDEEIVVCVTAEETFSLGAHLAGRVALAAREGALAVLVELVDEVAASVQQRLDHEQDLLQEAHDVAVAELLDQGAGKQVDQGAGEQHDDDLVARIRQDEGALEAFNLLVAKYQDTASEFAFAILSRIDLAHAAVQTAFFYLWSERDGVRRICSYDPDKRRSFSTYLFTLVKWRALDLLRRGRCRPVTRPIEDLPDPKDHSVLEEADELRMAEHYLYGLLTALDDPNGQCKCTKFKKTGAPSDRPRLHRKVVAHKRVHQDTAGWNNDNPLDCESWRELDLRPNYAYSYWDCTASAWVLLRRLQTAPRAKDLKQLKKAFPVVWLWFIRGLPPPNGD